jgi:hypothetical protein
MKRLGLFGLVAAVAMPLAAAGRDPASLGSLTIPAARVPDWYVPARLDTSSWARLDVTSSVEMQRLGCAPADPGDSAADDTAALACAAEKAPDQTRLYLPRGVYNLKDRKGAGFFIRRSHVALVGDGPDATTIAIEGGEGVYQRGCNMRHHIAVCGDPSAVEYPWTAGYSEGSTALTLGRVTDLQPGDWVIASEDNDGDGVQLGGNDLQKPFQLAYLAKVTAVDPGTRTIRIDRPLRHDFGRPTSSGQKVSKIAPVERVGFESLRIYKRPRGGEGVNPWSSFVHWVTAVEGWIYDVRFEHGAKHAVEFTYRTARILVARSHFHDFDDPEVYSQETVDLGPGSYDHAIVDNLFTDTKAGVNLQMGTAGNVIAYNAFIERAAGCTYRQTFFHGNWVRSNLIEGNHWECLVDLDKYYGSQGPKNTFYRNRQGGGGAAADQGCAHKDPEGSCAVGGDDPQVIRIHPDRYNKPPVLVADQLNMLMNISRDFSGKFNCGRDEPLSKCFEFELNLENLWFERNVAQGIFNLDPPLKPSTRMVANRENRRASARRPDTPDWDRFCAQAPPSLVAQWNRPEPPPFWCAELRDAWAPARGIGACGDDLTVFRAPTIPALRRFLGASCTGPGAARASRSPASRAAPGGQAPPPAPILLLDP